MPDSSGRAPREERPLERWAEARERRRAERRSERYAEPLRPLSYVLQRPTIGIDIGGTKVAGGVLDVDGRILQRGRRETPDRSKSPQVVEDTIVDLVAELASDHDIAAVGIGAAGFVDAARASVLFAPHLSWRNEPLRDAIHQRLRLPVVVENDANAALWAEWRFGAGQGEDHLVCVNLGTGIGGAIMIGGELQRGKYGVAGEFGHMQVVPGGHRCECGNRGCWEQYASGNALVREAKELARTKSPMAHRLLELMGGDLDAITGPSVTAAALQGEQTAIELLADVGSWLGQGIANLAAALDPDLFVIGGGVSAAGDLLLLPARQMFTRTLTGRGFRPEARLELAHFRNDAGLIGAADLSRRALFEPPESARFGLWPRRKARKPGKRDRRRLARS
jgi:glucokinase